MTLVLIGASGWLLVLLVPLTGLLAARLRRGAGMTDGTLWQRLRPHYWVGYTIAALALFHVAVATGTGAALHADAAGLYVATGALLLVFVQVFLGLLLREPSLRRRPTIRRRHILVMVGIIVLALVHIALNSALLHKVWAP